MSSVTISAIDRVSNSGTKWILSGSLGENKAIEVSAKGHLCVKAEGKSGNMAPDVLEFILLNADQIREFITSEEYTSVARAIQMRKKPSESVKTLARQIGYEKYRSMGLQDRDASALARQNYKEFIAEAMGAQ